MDEMREDYVRKHCFKKYKEVQGLKLPEGKPLVDVHSYTTNLGLINIKTKNETKNMNKFIWMRVERNRRNCSNYLNHSLCYNGGCEVLEEEAEQV